MSEFMLIMSGEEKSSWPPLTVCDDPAAILQRLTVCLHDLDRIEARLAAAYLKSAIHHLRVPFDLDEDISKTD